MLVGMQDWGSLVPSRWLGSLTKSTGNQAVDMDCLAFSGGHVFDLDDQGRRKGQNIPRAPPKFS